MKEEYKLIDRSPEDIIVLEALSYFHDLRYHLARFMASPMKNANDFLAFTSKAYALLKSLYGHVLRLSKLDESIQELYDELNLMIKELYNKQEIDYDKMGEIIEGFSVLLDKIGFLKAGRVELADRKKREL